MKFKLIKIPKILSMFPLALLIASCGANFEQIEEFGLTSAIIQESSENMAQDIYQSCLRQNKYTEVRFPQSIGFTEKKAQQKDCEQSKKEAQVFNDANLVLINYMVALGKLANNDTVSFDQKLHDLENSLKTLNIILTPSSSNLLNENEEPQGIVEQEKIDAGLKIAQFIFNQLTTQFRRENLQEAILCTNKSVQEYIPGLKLIAEEFYINGVLSIEKSKIDDHYRKYAYFRELKLPKKENGQELTSEETSQLIIVYTQLALADYSFEKDYIKALNALDEKKEAANAYIAIVQATANTHKELFDEFNLPAMDAQEIEVFCQEYFAEDGDESSPQTSSLTFPQLKRVEQIVTEYTNEIEPHIKKLDKSF